MAVLKYTKQKLIEMKGEIDKYTNIVNYFNIFLPIDRTSRKSVEIQNNNTITQLEITDIYRIILPITAEYALFSSAHVMVIKIHHILDYKF